MIKDDFYIIGLTGGIGSGKSTIARHVKDNYAAQVIFTDDIARDQMQYGGVSYGLVVGLLGEKILNNFGEIDRTILAELMFSDDELRHEINRLTHPPVHKIVMKLIDDYRNDEMTKYVLIETALLIEAGYQSFCDAVWYVYAPENERMERLCSSRAYSEKKAKEIFMAQKSDEEYRLAADYIINNSNNVNDSEIVKQISIGIRQLKEH